MGNSSDNIISNLDKLNRLPRFPTTLFKLQKLFNDPDNLTHEAVASVVETDSRMSAALISEVNGKLSSDMDKTSSVSEATHIVGLGQVEGIVKTISYKDMVTITPPFSRKKFLKHSIASAQIAQTLAEALHLDRDDAYMIGMMKDIGVYLLASEDRQKYQEVLDACKSMPRNHHKFEQEKFGVHHGIIGARLLQKWNFSKNVIMGVAMHDMPEKAKNEYRPYAYLARLSELAANKIYFENGITSFLCTYLNTEIEKCLDELLITDDVFESVLSEVCGDRINQACA